MILAVPNSSRPAYGLARCSNHWRLRGYVVGVGESGWAWAERGSWPWQAWERSLVYCLRILRCSCQVGAVRERERDGRDTAHQQRDRIADEELLRLRDGLLADRSGPGLHAGGRGLGVEVGREVFVELGAGGFGDHHGRIG